MRRSTVQSRFSPRPRGSTVVRKLLLTGGIDYVEDTHGRLETRADRTAGFETEFQNADRVKRHLRTTYDFLPVPFRIAPGVTLPRRRVHFDNIRAAYTGALRRRWSGEVFAERGHVLQRSQDVCGSQRAVA